MMQKARDEIAALPEDEDPEFLLHQVGDVERLINGLTETALALTARISPSDVFSERFTLRRISPESIFGLEAASRALHRRRPEPTIDPSQLSMLIEQLRKLIDDVSSSNNLTPEAKLFLIRRLREIETALLGSRITGFADLEDAVDRLTGALVRRDDIRDAGIMKKIGSFFQKLVQAAQGTSAIAGATTATVQAIEAITKYQSGT